MDKYDNYIEYALGSDEQSMQKIAQFKKNYLQYFPVEKTETILDIGAGKGEMLSCLAESGYLNIEAVDISESVVNFIRKLGFRISRTNDLTSFLNTRKEQFALVTMCDVVEHIPDEQILDILSAVRNSLKKNGMLIVQVPNMQSITANLFRYDDFTHETGYTERSLTQMLKLSGYSSVHCHGFEFLDNSLKAKVQYVLRATLWFFEKIKRKINGTMPHKIMHPVFFALAKK